MDSGDVDLVVLDVMLPGVDGFTICRTVRARSDLPIIIVTARSDTADVIEDGPLLHHTGLDSVVDAVGVEASSIDREPRAAGAHAHARAHSH